MTDSIQSKRRKIATFNDVYYNGDPHDWKVKRLPDWMNFYGHSLNNELKGKTPKYYRKFSQGTIVMINYGVTVGSEMGGKHFGIVLSNNDTKYKREIVVVPLSSKSHRDYVYLGYDLLNGANALLNQKMEDLANEFDSLTSRLEEFRPKFNSIQFSFTKSDLEYLSTIKSETLPGFIAEYTGNDKTVSFDTISVNFNLEGIINDIKESPSWENHPGVFEFVSRIDTLFSFSEEIKARMKQINERLENTKKLRDKVEKYNKQSFANTGAIRSISKLRVEKLTEYSITGNVKISEMGLDKIKKNIFKFLE